MPEVQRTKRVRSGGWRTLEWGVNATFAVRFFLPAGAEVKVRKGAGWPLGWDSQKQRLDGLSPRLLSVSGALPSRVQMKTARTTDVTSTYIVFGR